MHPVKHWITNNWFLKVLSVVLSLMLWVAVASESTSEIGLMVPLEYRNVPADMEITGDVASSVEVRLRGSANLIKELSPNELSATVDLSGIGPGETTIPLTAENVRAPLGTEVVAIRPSHVQFNLVRRPSRRREGGTQDKRIRP